MKSFMFNIIKAEAEGWRRIGLTGGIGTGKTTVSQYLAEAYQLPILDADFYARRAVEPGSAILGRVAERYGAEVLRTDGNLNRRRLGQIVFNDPLERQWLEQQIHPYVRQMFATDLARLEDGDAGGVPAPCPVEELAQTVVLAIPLLFESQLTSLVTEVWVVSCSREQQLERVVGRDRISPQAAQARIDSQMPLTEKVALADVILDNSSTEEALLQQVDDALKYPPATEKTDNPKP